jgi:hypothetical protein
MQRRRERRYTVWESVVLTIQEPQLRHSAAMVVDISCSGYRVLSAMALAVGAEVVITLNSVAIIGRVRHCSPTGVDSFAAGVEITEVAGGVAERSTSAGEYSPASSDLLGTLQEPRG